MAELRHYQAFVEVAKERSISGAADRMSVSQPALSKQIAELERDLGLKLFERRARGVSPTEAGKQLLPFARRIATTVAEAEREAMDLHGLKSGRIVMGASTTIADYLLPPALALFTRRHPGVTVSLRVGNTSDIARAVHEEQCEIGLVEGPTDEPNLDLRPFFQDELYVIAPPGHPLLTVGAVSPAAALAYGIVLREPGSGTRAVFEEAIHDAGVRFTEVATLGSNEAVKRAVRLRVGIGVVSRLAVADELEAGLLEVVPIEGLRMRRPLTRLIRVGRTASRTLRALVSALDDSLVRDPMFHGFGVPSLPDTDWDPSI
jgi:DNA-binding transcriptional LysR family regulator